MSGRGNYIEVDNFSGKWKDYKLFTLKNNNGEKYITGYNKKTKEQLRRYEYKMAVPYSKEWYKLYMRASRSLGFDDKSGTRNNPRRRFPDSNFQVKGAEKVKMTGPQRRARRQDKEGVFVGKGGIKEKNRVKKGRARYQHLSQSEKDDMKEEVKESKKLEAKLLKEEKAKIKEQKEVNKAFKEASKKVSSEGDEPPQSAEKKGRGKGKVDKKKAFQDKAKERSEAVKKIQTQFRKKKEEDKKKKEAEEKKKEEDKKKKEAEEIKAKEKENKEKKEKKERIAKQKKEKKEKEDFTSDFNKIRKRKILEEGDDGYEGWRSEMSDYSNQTREFDKLLKIAEKRNYPKKTIDRIKKEINAAEYMRGQVYDENAD